MPHDHDSIRDAILDAIDLSEHADKPAALRVIGILHDVTAAACTLLSELEDQDAEAVSDAAEWIFDKLIVPIDLPLNDWVEGWVESQVRGLIRPTIRQAVGELR